MKFIYPDNLFLEIEEAWQIKSYQNEIIPPLPDRIYIEDMLNVVYHASFLTEESRRVWFRIIFVNQASLVKVERDIFDYTNIIVFQHPREFNVSELLKLAPAADPTQVLIGVYIDNISNKLIIWGLIDTGVSWWEFVREESSHGAPPPGGLTISSKSPGQINISRQGDVLLMLKYGKLFRPSREVFDVGPVATFLENGARILYEEICSKLKIGCFDSDEDDDYPKRFYVYFIKRILNRIREKFHGGTLIIIPDSINLDDTRLTDRLLIKYPCEYSKTWDCLKDELDRYRKYYDLHFRLLKQEVITKAEYEEVNYLEYLEEYCDEHTSNAAGFISALSGVDGAVLITDKLRLLGFGVEITAVSPTLKEVKVISDLKKGIGEYQNIDLFGTRHRSALRFCSSFENSIVFIVSQDGDVKVAKRVASEVILWPDINIGSLGF
ncbi:MAG: diadenylate cyclase [Candidatus Omnitrophica bacterium]|nr:diadenylate cyclase [Candidatus Omnitrophota bacterium]